MILKRSSYLVVGFALASVLSFVVNAQTQTPQTVMPTPSPSTPAAGAAISSEAIGTALALLDRIDRIAAGARKDVDTDDLKPVATSGRAGATATLPIRAADLDEIRAEVAQIKALLKADRER